MGLFEWLGLGDRAASDVSDDRTEVVARIGDALAALPPERARVLAAFAYLLGRVAHADHALTPEETAAMEQAVRREGGLSEEQARAVVAIASAQSRLFRGTEDFRVAQEFGAIATPEDRRALLRCLFAVSASDESVVLSEDNEIRRITQELKIPHEEFVEARASVRQHLAVLRRASSTS